MNRQILTIVLALGLLFPLTASQAQTPKPQQSIMRPKAGPIIKKLKPAQAERLSRMAMEYGERMLRARRFDVAIKQLRTAHKLNRKNETCISLLAQAHAAKGEVPEAAAYNLKLHELQCPTCLDLVLLRGWADWVGRVPHKTQSTDLPPGPNK
ncbi:MAG: hypothetical protein JRF33_19925 [Deltaproteobacteria bacterium]|nr:hypothetical protein [Deltaproteobacteria bacterium]